jgi:hypothetical protein
MSGKSKVIKRESTVLVTRELTVGRFKRETVDKQQDLHQLAVHEFIAEPAKVSLSKGLTVNFGNYQFGRFDVGIEFPCYAEEVQDTLVLVDRFIEDRLAVESENIQQFFKAQGK